MEQDLGNKILASGCTISLKAIHTNFHIFTVASLFYNQYNQSMWKGGVLPVDGVGDDVNLHCSLLHGIFHYLEGCFLPWMEERMTLTFIVPCSVGSFTIWKVVSYRWMEEEMRLKFIMPC